MADTNAGREGLVGRCVLVRSSYPPFVLIDVKRETAKMIYGTQHGRSRDEQARKDRIAKVDATARDIQQLNSAQAEFSRRRADAVRWLREREAEILGTPTEAQS